MYVYADSLRNVKKGKTKLSTPELRVCTNAVQRTTQMTFIPTSLSHCNKMHSTTKWSAGRRPTMRQVLACPGQPRARGKRAEGGTRSEQGTPCRRSSDLRVEVIGTQDVSWLEMRHVELARAGHGPRPPRAVFAHTVFTIRGPRGRTRPRPKATMARAAQAAGTLHPAAACRPCHRA